MPSRTPANPEQLARLEVLAAQASRVRGLWGLSEEELLEFARLYRRAAAQLAYARAYGLEERELDYLNALVGRSYGLLYTSESAGWAGVRRFFRSELPRTMRRHGRVLALAAALFLGSALLGALAAALRPDFLELLNPRLAAAVDSIAARHEGGRNWLPSEMRPLAASSIIANNIQVCFFAFSGGMLAGLGTLFVLVFNGLVLGALVAGVSRTPAAPHFWGFVAPHGALELPAIVFSAAAGLLLGLAILAPGNYSRADALRLAGREAAVIVLGVVCVLVVAGFVEGLFSPAVLPLEVKLAACALLSALLWGYLLLAGRKA